MTSFTPGLLFRYEPHSATFTTYTVSLRGSERGTLYGLLVATSGDVWVTILAEDMIAHLDGRTGHFLTYRIPSPGSLLDWTGSACCIQQDQSANRTEGTKERMQWNPKSRMKKGVTHLPCLWILMMFLASFVTSCGYSRGDPSANMPSPTVIPHKKASPLASSPTPAVQPAAPHILPGDWPSFLLGSGGYNRYETAITPSTASSLTRSWVAHAGGGISSEPVVVDGTIYWGTWDGYEHATSIDGRARGSTFLGKVSNPQCYPPTAGVASTATVMPIMIKGVQTLVGFVGGGDAPMYALNALHW